MKFGDFANEWSGIVSQRMPRRKSVDEDGRGKSQPEKAEHILGCLNNIDSLREIEHC